MREPCQVQEQEQYRNPRCLCVEQSHHIPPLQNSSNYLLLPNPKLLVVSRPPSPDVDMSESNSLTPQTHPGTSTPPGEEESEAQPQYRKNPMGKEVAPRSDMEINERWKLEGGKLIGVLKRW